MPHVPAQPSEDRHTKYLQYALLLKKAKEDIINYGPYLLTFTVTSKQEKTDKISANIEQYLVPVDPNNNPMQKQIARMESSPNPDQAKIRTRKGYHQQYVEAFNKAVTSYQEMSQKIQQLVNTNSMFQAPDSKQNEYLHIIDTDTCRYLCESQKQKADCPQQYNGNGVTLELTGKQTDALRIWRNHVTVSNLIIKDNRVDTETAHRDAIQLIPPPRYRQSKKDAKGNVTLIKELDQSGGTVLKDVTIKNIKIHAPQAALQGIFSSDGMCQNLKLQDIEVGTKGAHTISISGVLTGCEMSNIKLYQQPGGPMPEIGLYPVRIGGNMADDGMVVIYSFAPGSDYIYGTVKQNNLYVYEAGSNTPKPIQVTDYRGQIPEKYISMAVGLRDFNYPKYLKEYTTWTLADFQRAMPQHFTKMKAWIDQRVREYSSGIREPSNEKD